MEGLILVLSGVVVKTAFRVWTHDNALADNLSVDLTDLIKDRVGGMLEQRKLRTRFTRIEEIVAERLLGSLQEEFRGLDEGDADAAIIAVTGTFGHVRLADGDLFASDLDPLSLERFIRRAAPSVTRDLGSADAIALYDRLLAECCAYVIEIADKLPRFQAGAFAELLRREHQVLDRIDEVLRRLPAPAQGRAARERVDTAYRQRLAVLFDRLELFGLDFAAPSYTLSIAYVNLTVTDPASPDPVRGREQRAGELGTVELRAGELAGGRGATFEDRVCEHARLVITGRAGSGKTTALQWLAVRAARKDGAGPARLLNDCTPYFLRLRDYADGELPPPEEFLDKVAPMLAPEDRAWPRQELAAGRALVLVDGVDELPEAKRPAIKAWLGELTSLFPQARYVVTTRPGAVDIAWLADLGFAAAALEPMTPELIRTFVGHWHAALREWLVDEDAREQLAALERTLLATIESDRFLRDLADTPLLAGLMCALNQHLRGQLPRRRSEIYEKALAMFDQRDRARNIVGDGLSLDLAARTQLLGDFALWLIRNGASEASLAQAREAVGRSSAVLSGGPWDAAALCRHLLLRSGLLREPAAGQVDFVHRTFQEYLAARALIAADNVGEIIRNASDDQWREVVILASGQGNLRQATDLLRGLLRPTWKGKQRYQRRLLAVACLQEVRGLSPDVQAAVERVIPDLLPPRSLDQAEILSGAGDRLLPLLAQCAPASDEEKVAVIRAAALIGGDEAMRLIAALGRDGSATVGYEIGRCWQYFDPQSYAEHVLSQGVALNLQLEDVRLIPLLAHASRVSSLHLRLGGGKLPSLTALASSRITVEDLWIWDAADETLDALASMDPVDLSILSWARLRDTSALPAFGRLRNLSIGWTPQLTDLSTVGQLTRLHRLSLFDLASPDLSPLADLSELRHLYASDCAIIDVTPLTHLTLNVHIADGTQLVGERGPGLTVSRSGGLLTGSVMTRLRSGYGSR